MVPDRELISQIENHIAQSDGNIWLSDFGIRDRDTMQCVLALIAQCPNVADWGVKIIGTDADSVLQTLVENSEQLEFRDGGPIIQRLTNITLYSTKLSDHGFRFLTAAAQTGQLQQLKSLSLVALITDASVICLADAAHAGQLQQLQSLDLLKTQITDTSMIRLADAAQAGQLQQLKFLHLADAQITDASVIRLADAARAGQIQQLCSLELSGTQITDASVIRLADAAQAGQLQQLQYLVLVNTQLTDASVFRLADAAQAGQLQQLTGLDLWFTQITDASVLRLADATQAGHFQQLQSLRLTSSRVSAPGVIHGGDFHEVFQWYRDRAKSKQLLPEMKLLIVGQGKVGKSVLFQRVLLGREPENLHDRVETHDFNMHDVQLPSDLISRKQFANLTLRVWDFAGQDQLHGSHNFFVGAERTFYLLVLDASRDSRENKLTYWLRFLAHHGTLKRRGDNLQAPVLIVVTQSDKIVLANEDRTSAGDQRTPQAILRNHRELLAALTSAVQQDYLGAHVLNVVHGLGYPSGDDLLALTSDARKLVETTHKKACGEIRRLIATNLKRVIGVQETVATSDRAIRDWVLAHFTPSKDKHLLTRFSFRDQSFRDWAQAQGFDRKENLEFDPDVLEMRFRNAMRILKSLGLVHWLGDVLAESDNADDTLNDVAFNPLWVKTPIYRILRAQGVKHAKGWISQTNVNALLPLRESRSFPCLVATENVREWFDHLRFTKEDRSAIRKLLELSGLMFEVTQQKRKEGWLIPDMLKETVDIVQPISGDIVTIKHSFPFLPDRVLLRFLAERLVEAFGRLDDQNDAIRELLSSCVFRNAADLPWKLAGSEEDYRVILRTEISPPVHEEPWLSISVCGGDDARRITVLTEVISKFNEILRSEELPLISLVDIRQRSPDIAKDNVHAASNSQVGCRTISPSTMLGLIEAVESYCREYKIAVAGENLTKPIPFSESLDPKIKKSFNLFLAIGTEYQRTDHSMKYPKCSSLANVITALSNRSEEQDGDIFADWPGADKLTTCRDYVYGCRKTMDRFFISFFGLEPIELGGRNPKSYLFNKKGGFQDLTPIGCLALERAREFVGKQTKVFA